MFTKFKQDVDIHETFFLSKISHICMPMHDWITKISIIQLVNTELYIYCPMFTKFIHYVDVHETFFFENQPDLPANTKLLTTFTLHLRQKFTILGKPVKHRPS